MTRDEEIKEQSTKYMWNQRKSHFEGYDIERAFKAGAQWADQHPKENLVDIDKVCEWIKDNATYYAHWEWNGDTYEKEVVFDTEECVEAFKQSIKEYLNYDTETDISN